jgi:hypothetical protein
MMLRNIFLLAFMAMAQPLVAQFSDSLPKPKLPFPIAPEKRLDDEEIREKVEGLYLTGLPEFEQNPINGFGIGGNFFLYQNGTRQDPFLNTRRIDSVILARSKCSKAESGMPPSTWIFPTFLIQNGALEPMSYSNQTLTFNTSALALLPCSRFVS